jgi:hypothetical protein
VYIKTGKQIIGKQFDLSNFNDLMHVFKILSHFSEIDITSKFGCTQMLDWLWENEDQLEFHKPRYSINWASQSGHVHVLDWFWNKKDQTEFKCAVAVDYALIGGHINVLNWFWDKKDQLGFQYSTQTITWTSQFGHPNVIEWVHTHINTN